MAFRVHPILSQALQGKPNAAVGRKQLFDWFYSRLPESQNTNVDNTGWHELHAEFTALIEWLNGLSVAAVLRSVEQQGKDFASQNGPFAAWWALCERGLQSTHDLDFHSSYLYTLANVALRGGDPDRALQAAKRKADIDRQRGDDRNLALAQGKIADVLYRRGELDEALRIRREEQLPVYERLGDVRELAVTQGKIADVLSSRGELDEALRIRREEELPVYERLGDVRSVAVTQGQIADVLSSRGELDEALRIRREEQLPVYERLGDVRSVAVTQASLSVVLLLRNQSGDLAEAKQLLTQALEACQRLRIPEAAQIAEMLASIDGSG
jgi:tetratricopeptide (TPR) repeat protein